MLLDPDVPGSVPTEELIMYSMKEEEIQELQSKCLGPNPQLE